MKEVASPLQLTAKLANGKLPHITNAKQIHAGTIEVMVSRGLYHLIYGMVGLFL